MKKTLGTMMAVGLTLAAAQAHGDMIIELKFNETGTVATNTAANSIGDFNLLAFDTGTTPGTYGVDNGDPTDLHSTDGLGLSGLTGDRAFDNRASNWGTHTADANLAYTGGVASLKTSNGNGFIDYTASGWIKSEYGFGSQPNNPDTDARPNVEQLLMIWRDSNRNLDLGARNNTDAGVPSMNLKRRDSTAANLSNVYTPNNDTTTTAWTAVNEWVFFAVTVQFDTVNTYTATFYAGDLTTGVSAIGSESWVVANAPLGAMGSSSNNTWTWGNDRNMLWAFDGLMDNLRFYNEALSLIALEDLRVGDGGTVPEPASLGLLALGAMCLIGRRRRA